MEFIAPAHRGQFLTLIEGFWTVGSIFLAGMAWALLPKRGWRALVLVAAAPLLLLIAVYPFLKESPHWLLAMGRAEEADVRLPPAAPCAHGWLLTGCCCRSSCDGQLR
jgi:MFS transporter, putative metabolite:H+ symporter